MSDGATSPAPLFFRRPVPLWGAVVVTFVVAALSYSAGRFAGPTAVETEHVEHSDAQAREVVNEKKSAELVVIERWRPARNPQTGELLKGCDGGVAFEGEKITGSKSLSDLTRSTDFASSSTSTAKTSTETRSSWEVGGTIGAQWIGDPAPLVFVGGTAKRRLLGGVEAGLLGGVGLDVAAGAPKVKSGTLGVVVTGEF